MTRVNGSIGWVIKNLVSKFGIGLITLIPFVLTVWVVWWVFNTVDHILQPAITLVAGRAVPGLGFAITLVAVILAGFFASNAAGRRVIQFVERLIPFIPVIRWVYRGFKQITESFSAANRSKRMKPVLTDFPRVGMKAIGFVTNQLTDEPGNRMMSVFVPTSPNPSSGYLQIVKEEELTPLDISIDEALRILISAGTVCSDSFVRGLAGNGE